MRYFLELAYKGTAYHGWQVQANAPTVQAALDKALSTILRQPIETVGSGRTDTGVHAEQQFVHFDVAEPIAHLSQMLLRLNSILPDDIAAKALFPVADNAHARFDAISRKYEYRIYTHKNPFLLNLGYHYPRPLDVERLNEVSATLLQHEDFECFSRVKTEVNHFRCQISQAYWEPRGNYPEAGMLVFHVAADRFLRGMVRAIVGTLLPVGRGQAGIAELERILHSKDRRQAGQAAPPQGLFLTRVEYPEAVTRARFAPLETQTRE